MNATYETDRETSNKIRIAPQDEEPRPAGTGWLKMIRGQDILELIEEAPLAFTLASIIALRARFKPGVNLMNGLNRGECFLGDYKAYGMSEQQYRTAKAQLQKWKFATFKPTSKGTTARLTDTRLFDVLNLSANGQANRRPTDKQRTPNDKQECKNARM